MKKYVNSKIGDLILRKKEGKILKVIPYKHCTPCFFNTVDNRCKPCMGLRDDQKSVAYIKVRDLNECETLLNERGLLKYVNQTL